jgi:hypothetical protein
VVRVRKRGDPGFTWFLDMVTVSGSDTVEVFPIFRWVSDEMFGFRSAHGSTEVASAIDACTGPLHRRYVAEQSTTYALDSTDPSLPPRLRAPDGYSSLPVDERFNDTKSNDYVESRNDVLRSLMLGRLMGAFKRWNSFDDYDDFFVTVDKPALIDDDWQSDAVFGRARMQSAALTSMVRLGPQGNGQGLPSNFAVRDDHLPGSATVQAALDGGQLYLVDTRILDEVPLQDKRYTCCPICLLWVDPEGDGSLVPLAIQLHQRPTDDATNPIFTPASPPADWLYAKMCVNHADLWLFQLTDHLTLTHLCTEPLIVAMHRHFPPAHPLFKLLRPHTKFQLGINALARQTLIGPGGLVEAVAPYTVVGVQKVIQRHYAGVKSWLDVMAFPRAVAGRGLGDGTGAAAAGLDRAGFHYLEDGSAMWTALRTYVADVLALAYPAGDADVARDAALGAFVAELSETFGSAPDTDTPRFPPTVETVDALVDILTSFLFTVTAEHSAMNFAQFESFSFVPFSPAHLAEPVPWADPEAPSELGKATMDDLVHRLPSRHSSAMQVATLFLLSQYTENEEMLLGPRKWPMWGATPFGPEERLQQTLKEIEQRIDERGSWFFMKPSKVPLSTAI